MMGRSWPGLHLKPVGLPAWKPVHWTTECWKFLLCGGWGSKTFLVLLGLTFCVLRLQNKSKDVSIPKKVMFVLERWLEEFWNYFSPPTIDPTSPCQLWSKFCPSVPSGGWMAPHDGIRSWRHVQDLRWQLGDEALLHTSVKALALGYRVSKGIFVTISSRCWNFECKNFGICLGSN